MAASSRVLPTAEIVQARRRADWSADLLPVFALLWVASVIRVVAGVLRGETFGVIGTMALIWVLLLPLLEKPRIVSFLSGHHIKNT